MKAAANHEVESCLIVEKLLPGFNYTDEEISQIYQMIMATHLPQTPKSHLDKILADADLDYLGRDDFFTIGNLLFKELQTAGILKTEDEWNMMQIRFLENHQYFTQTALQRRQAKKEAHLALLKAKIK
ncbi:hypothetical protein GCM10027037_07900 [Mucilaginibacter koreensis]